MVLVISNSIQVPLKYFYDSISRNDDGRAVRTATAIYDKEKFDYSKVNELMELLNNHEFFELSLIQNDEQIWYSTDFNSFEMYSFEVNTEDPNTESNNLIFTVASK